MHYGVAQENCVTVPPSLSIRQIPRKNECLARSRRSHRFCRTLCLDLGRDKWPRSRHLGKIRRTKTMRVSDVLRAHSSDAQRKQGSRSVYDTVQDADPRAARISHQHHGTDFQGLSISGSASSLQLSELGSCIGHISHRHTGILPPSFLQLSCCRRMELKVSF